jgi:hypothetical protein
VADSLGPIPIPDPPTIGAFPLKVEYGSGFDYAPPIAVQQFDQAGLKVEQRFIMGGGAKHFRVQRARLACSEYDELRAHWEQAYGVYAQFPFTYSTPDGVDETYTCRYEKPAISFQQLMASIMNVNGLTLLEIPTPPAPYTSVATVTRFPDATLSAALRADVQRIIPLITIQDRAQATGPIYLSNQRVTVNGNLYLPRLLSWEGVQQSIGEAADAAKFTFGNADGVFTQLANKINLNRALVQLSLYHVDASYLIQLWSGYAIPYAINPDGTFDLGATDGTFQMSLAYPVRLMTRTCWKNYKGLYCPSTSSFPDCPKDFDSCVARGVPHSFGGAVVPAQAVRIYDSTTGVLGWGRSMMTSVTVSDDTIYQRSVQEVYTDQDMLVTCDVAAGRDENSFYAAIGVVSDGPVGKYESNLLLHTLDGQPPHDPLRGGGWRGVLGNDPAAESDFFGIDQAPWDVTPPGSTWAAGLAFAEIRRTDALGLQLAPVTERKMQVTLNEGVGGWIWTAPGSRVWQPGLANCVWVAVNVYLRGIGLRCDPTRATLISSATMEQYFDVNQAISAAALCDLMADKLVGTGQERQYPFRGVLKDRKPLKNWLTEILNCCLGFYTFVNGKLWIGIRNDSSVRGDNQFDRDTILYKSLQTPPISPAFNWLTVQFGDEEFFYQLNNVTIYDKDHAALTGTPETPNYLTGTMNLVGVSNKSQAARIATTRLREELGGILVLDGDGNVVDDQQLRARDLNFNTTVIALGTQIGDVIGLTHDTLAGGYAEGRVSRWTLNPDFSISIQATPTTDHMYDMTVGDKPQDVPAQLPRPEVLPVATGLAWMPNHIAPFAGDPLYPDPLERSFDLWQDYSIQRDGTWNPAVYVEGELVINTFISLTQPRLVAAILGGGGQLAGGQTVYAAVVVSDANGQPALPSNLIALWIANGLTNQKITFAIIPPPIGTWARWDLYVGTDRRRIAWQEGATGALPLALDITGPIHPMTRELPEAAARKVRLKAKQVWHSGVVGVAVTSVTAPNKIQSNDFIGSTDDWVGRFLSALADFSDGSAPLWNFTVTAFDSVTGEFTVSPDCVQADPADSVQEGDVLIVRSWADSVSADGATVTDPLWNNSVNRAQFGAAGFNPGEEKTRIARIQRGTGAGQYGVITDNTDISYTVNPPFAIKPDKTSIITIEATDWAYTGAESSDADVAQPGAVAQIRLRIDNLRDRVALIGAFLVDSNGAESDEQFAVYREIFVFGQPPTVRVIGPDPLDPDGNKWKAFETDHTIRMDTSANDIELELPPLYVYQGRKLVVWNDGENQGIIDAAPGEILWDGSTSTSISQGQSASFTSG